MSGDKWVWYALGLIAVSTAFLIYRLYGKASGRAR